MNLRHTLLGLMAPALLATMVACNSDTAYTVGGTIAGSVGPVVLQLNANAPTTVTAPGAFTLAGEIGEGAAYTVTLVSAAQNCTLGNATGTISNTNLSNVTVTCGAVVRSASLAGAAENPAVTTAASGSGGVVVNPATREISGGVSFAGLTPTTGGHHIHQAPAGNASANGPVIIPLVLAPDGRSAVVPAGAVLTEAQYAALVAGELYLNVHTAANPGGEIRGQLNLRGAVTAATATLSGTQEVPANASTASGRGTVIVDTNTLDVIVAYETHNVVGATVSHIHTGAVGVNGPANVVTFRAGTNMFVAPAGVRLTAQQLIDLKAGNHYFNVHSATFPGGEIRGQAAVQ